LGPGDYIVVPSSPKPKDLSNQIGQQYNEDQKYLDLDPLRRKFGRDLKISQSSSSSRLGDLKVSQNGDLDFIDGKDNVEQAIRIKFSTERGELSVHPEFGNLFELGRKINLVRFQQYKMATRQTLLQDPRVESVKNLKVFSEGNIITVTATI
jgi:phage baseplate assembly protein W